MSNLTAAQILQINGMCDGARAISLGGRMSLYLSTAIVVSTDGSDTTGEGTFSLPYKTITKAFTIASAIRPLILVMPGEYAEVDLVWPSANGVILKAPYGNVVIQQTTKAATSVLTIAPTSTASWSASIQDIEIESDYISGKCLTIANAGMSANKKMNIELSNVALSTKNVTDSSLVVTNTVATGAMRVYASGSMQTWEGLVLFTTLNASDRLRIYNHRIIGAVTMSGSVSAAEITLINCATPTVTCATAALNNINCWHETDADPDVYTAYTNAYDT
jgi:hypothetical protein